MLIAYLQSGSAFYASAFLFLAIFSDSLGVPVPGNTLILAAGAFSGQGFFSPYAPFLAVVAGNLAGDAFCYWIARRYGNRVIGKLRIDRKYLRSLESFLSAYPRSSVFASRFAGALDPAINAVSGIAEVPVALFISYAALGDFALSAALFGTGYALGGNWERFSAFAGAAGWIAFLAFLALALVVSFRKQLGIEETRAARMFRKFLRRFERKAKRDALVK